MEFDWWMEIFMQIMEFTLLPCKHNMVKKIERLYQLKTKSCKCLLWCFDVIMISDKSAKNAKEIIKNHFRLTKPKPGSQKVWKLFWWALYIIISCKVFLCHVLLEVVLIRLKNYIKPSKLTPLSFQYDYLWLLNKFYWHTKLCGNVPESVFFLFFFVDQPLSCP